MSAVDDGDAIRAMQSRLDDLRGQRDELNEQVDAVVEQITRYEAAIGALTGDFTKLPNRRSATAGKAIVAALGTFKSPVRTEDLLDHDSLIHYSRHTLRGALSELHRAGKITGTRAPKGFIWDPPGM